VKGLLEDLNDVTVGQGVGACPNAIQHECHVIVVLPKDDLENIVPALVPLFKEFDM
jgi:hypothetical protein